MGILSGLKSIGGLLSKSERLTRLGTKFSGVKIFLGGKLKGAKASILGVKETFSKIKGALSMKPKSNAIIKKASAYAKDNRTAIAGGTAAAASGAKEVARAAAQVAQKGTKTPRGSRRTPRPFKEKKGLVTKVKDNIAAAKVFKKEMVSATNVGEAVRGARRAKATRDAPQPNPAFNREAINNAKKYVKLSDPKEMAKHERAVLKEKAKFDRQAEKRQKQRVKANAKEAKRRKKNQGTGGRSNRR